MYDAIVVGAGPAGGMAAREIARAGFRALVIDKKRVLGEPVQCAEGVSRFGLESNGIRPRDEWVAQEVSGATCVLPNGTSFSITDLPGYAIDRPAFDRWLVAEAADRGAVVRTSTRVTGITRHGAGWRVVANGDAFDARTVIASDGPTSGLARTLGLFRRQETIRAYEFRFRRDEVEVPDPHRFYLYVGRRYDGGYAWVFPRGEHVNVGAGGHIDAFAAASSFCWERGYDPARRIQSIAGTIPYRYELSTYALPGFAVSGDAAGVTNPMNGAGIHPGLFSGRLAAESAIRSLESGDPGAMAAYDRALRASPFLDPILFWMIERVRTWSDRILNDVGDELHGLSWRDITLRRVASAALRKPHLILRAAEFNRTLRALELCEHFGW
jgi:digeranylgeranylglycerophospholipid reductase